MKKDIHPTYYKNTKVKCSCGNEFSIPSTKEIIEVDVCSNCHPFYTGSEKGKMRGSQVEKFRERLSKKSPKSASSATRQASEPSVSKKAAGQAKKHGGK